MPPIAKRVEHRQVWHGETFVDHYFWLREKANPEVTAYLEAENAYTREKTKDLAPLQGALYAEMLARLKQTDFDVPTRDGDFYYYSRTIEGRQYPVYCRRKAAADGVYDPAAPEVVLLDQNAMAEGKAFLSIGGRRISDDGARLAYLTDEVGFRQYRLQVKDLATGAVRADLAERVTSAVWAADSTTLYYTTEDAGTKRSDRLWRLSPGAAPELLHVEKDELFSIVVTRTKDRRFLLLEARSTDTWQTWMLDAAATKGSFAPVLPRVKGHKYDVEHRDGVLYFRTNLAAKQFRVTAAPVATPAPEFWKEFAPHRADTLLEDVQVFRDHLVAQEKREGLVRFRVYLFAKDDWREIAFPEAVYDAGPGGTPEFHATAFRVVYESPTTPPTTLDYDFATLEPKVLKRREVLGGYDPSRYVAHRLFAPARDGVRVPITLVARKDVPRDGTAPLWLYAYGSYGFGETASFRDDVVSIVERGVVYAIAHVRGGDELGETWHDDGMLMKKKNTFFDFIDCAEFLVRERYAARDRIAAEGGSAGGLLMGAVANLRPDLFRAIHAAVPFVDVLNTMMDASLPLTVGEYLEWGDPNEKAAFDYLRSYSPYDNLAAKDYPAILVTTSFHDSQVMYWEPAKYVAKLRALKTDRNELLFKCKMEAAGHGGASGRYDRLKDRAFETAWVLKQLGLSVAPATESRPAATETPGK
jgi:oligopeptidase B